MKAMILEQITPIEPGKLPLKLVDLPKPEPKSGEILVKISTCGVCHTELDEIEGRTSPPKLPIVLGHEIIGCIEELGSGVTKHEQGDRVGIGWIHSSTGDIRENLSSEFRATGRDVNGGYAEYITIGEDYAYPIPAVFSDSHAAPLLCAGAVGYRALKIAAVNDRQSLGLTGFGGSAHLVLQLAKHLIPNSKIFVFARHKETRDFALELGAFWAGDIAERTPEPLKAIIDTTPVWTPIVEALANLQPGGRLVINAIRKEDIDKTALLGLSYDEHLWLEKEIKSVANVTHYDLNEFLPLAAEIPIKPEVQTYPLEEANTALCDLKKGKIKGAKVLVIDGKT